MADANPTFFWYELMTGDPEAAKQFYGEVVGWQTEDLGGAHAGYSLLKAGDQAVGGVMGLSGESCGTDARPGWFGYVRVADVDAAVARLEGAGGHVLRAPDDIPEVGRFAVVADPGGAAFMLMTPQPQGDVPAPLPRMSRGNVGWHELYAEDGEAAFAFYRNQFGWREVSTMDMGPMGTYRLWGPGGAADGEAIGGMMTRMPQMPQAVWNYYFVVDGIDAAAERIRAAGGEITHGPMAVPDGSWIVSGVDPQGAHFSLVSETK